MMRNEERKNEKSEHESNIFWLRIKKMENQYFHAHILAYQIESYVSKDTWYREELLKFIVNGTPYTARII